MPLSIKTVKRQTATRKLHNQLSVLTHNGRKKDQKAISKMKELASTLS